MDAQNQYDIKLVDTFGGQPNYSWVYRETLSINANYCNAWIVRKAKESMGLTGIRGKTENYGDSITVQFPQLCQVMFINLSNA